MVMIVHAKLYCGARGTDCTKNLHLEVKSRLFSDVGALEVEYPNLPIGLRRTEDKIMKNFTAGIVPAIGTDPEASSRWLSTLYFTRAAVAAIWFVAAFASAAASPASAAALLIAYPAWDALANLLDARRSGGLKRNRSQALNVIVSSVATLAVASALTRDLHTVMAAFGAWALLAGMLQLLTGVRRWMVGAQWAMILAGAQSALVGVYFIEKATQSATVGIADIAPYAAFGAFYFLVSAVWLTVTQARRRATQPIT
jgi:uncharacterized membrane protein HdeD (DUF308 family)